MWLVGGTTRGGLMVAFGEGRAVSDGILYGRGGRGRRPS